MTTTHLRDAAGRTFFRNFFSMLLFAISAAEWVTLWWLFWPRESTPFALHVVAIGAVYLFNRRFTGGFARRASRPRWRRVYEAFAFTSLFCAVFLLLTFLTGELTQLLVGTVLAAVHSSANAVVGGELAGAFAWVRSVGFGLIVFTFVYGYTYGQARLKVTWMRLPLRNFGALPRLRIAQISDIHIGQNLTREQLLRFVERANGVEADILCITGDIADNARADLARFLPLLAKLRAKRAVVAILGNHDHYAGAARVEEALQRHTDFIVLRDAHVTIDVDGKPLHIVGLDDRGVDWARGVPAVPYLGAVLASLPPQEPVLVLSHRPDVFAQCADLGVGLTLSGHTHGGQVALPSPFGRPINAARMVTRFDRGLFRKNGSVLYVNNGLGVTAQRVRLCTPREISVFEVEPQADLR
jgi:predicted MPP superfamily phosphohydrolase